MMSNSAAHRLLGEIEGSRPLRAHSGHLRISGWCLIEHCPEAPSVRLFTEAGILPASHRISRPDVAALLPSELAAGSSGFEIQGHLPSGIHIARFEAQLPDQSWKAFKLLSLFVESSPFHASVEHPQSEGTLASRVFIDGWTLSPTSTVRTLSLRYGHQEIAARPGLMRDDVASHLPAGSIVEARAFRSETILSAGQGLLRVKAKLSNGTAVVVPTKLHVDITRDENHGDDLKWDIERTPLPRYKAHPPTFISQNADSAPLNILFILPGSFAANSALHVAALANELSRRGHRCSVAVTHDLSTLSHHKDPAFRGITYDKVVRGEAFPDGSVPDLVHAWTTRENVRRLVDTLQSKHRCPLIVHLEDNELNLLALTLGCSVQTLSQFPLTEIDRVVPKDLSHPHRSRDFLNAAAGVTVITDRLREFTPPGHACLTLWPAADNRFFFPRPIPKAFRKQLNRDRHFDETVLFYHGNVHASNVGEVSELYAAVLQLNQSGHPTTLIRTGRNQVPLPSHLSAQPHVLELGQILHHQHLPELMALADIFVQPGEPDDFNNYRFPSKLPEFFSIGRPVILPRSNLGQVVRHKVDAYVLDRADALAITTAVIELRQNHELSRRLAEGALNFAEKHFSWTRSAHSLELFYHEVIASAKSRDR